MVFLILGIHQYQLTMKTITTLPLLYLLLMLSYYPVTAQNCVISLDSSSSFSANTFSHIQGTSFQLPCPTEVYLGDTANQIGPSIVLNNALLGYSHAANTQNQFLCPTGSEGDAFVHIKNPGSNSVSIVWDVRADAEMDCFDNLCGYFARGYAHMDATLDLNFNIPPNNIGVLVYSYGLYSAVGNRPEAVNEDTAYVEGVTLTIDTSNLLPGNFDIPAGTHGRYRGNSLFGQTGLLYVGAGGGTTMNISATSYAAIYPPARPPGQSEHEDGAWAEYYGFMDMYLICVDTSTQPLPTQVPDSILALLCPQEDILFSVDLGSDTEYSDPANDGNESFDPGDMFKSGTSSVAASLVLDDADMLGTDPTPTSTDLAPVCAVNDGSATDSISWFHFDLDAADRIHIDLSAETFGPGNGAIGYVPGYCVFEPTYMLLSFDEDPFGTFAGENFACDVPTNPIHTLGQATKHDEVLTAINNTSFSTLSLTYLAGPLFSESELHSALQNDPDTSAAGKLSNDDVDALDAYSDTAQCNYQYFSVDHEARYIVGNDTLRPGVIYQADLGNNSIQPVIVPEIHLGLNPDVDIDAFEFAWFATPLGPPELVLVFSVDGDDFNTIALESDTLNPGVLYFSNLNGTHFRLSRDYAIWEDDQGPFQADIDALAFTCKYIPAQGVTVYPPSNPVGIKPMDEKEATLALGVYPNPNTGNFLIEYTQPVAGSVSFSLMDLSGRQVYFTQQQEQAAGQYQFELNANTGGLADGVYLLQMNLHTNSGIRQIHQKVVIQR